jgi:hypothetical protein
LVVSGAGDAASQMIDSSVTRRISKGAGAMKRGLSECFRQAPRRLFNQYPCLDRGERPASRHLSDVWPAGRYLGRHR